MNARSDAVPSLIRQLAELGGLTGADIANMTGVSRATVWRWKMGAVKPRPGAQRALSELREIVGRLGGCYTAGEVRAWLHACHPQLEGARAAELIRQNRPEEVLRVLDRLEGDVYV